jgi:hypothetical protein
MPEALDTNLKHLEGDPEPPRLYAPLLLLGMVPGGHAEHVDAPAASENVWFGHATQVVFDTEPTAVEYVPARHFRHGDKRSGTDSMRIRALQYGGLYMDPEIDNEVQLYKPE